MDQKKSIAAAVEEERVRIVEASKQFVLERENESQTKVQELLNDIQAKEKMIERYEEKVKSHNEQCEQYKYSLEQEQKAYKELLASSEELQASKTHPVCADDTKELQKILEKTKKQNEELREDFAKMVDDFEKTRKKETLETEKLKSSFEKLKSMCEKKDVELKRLKGKQATNPEKLADNITQLKKKLAESNDQYIKLELQMMDLQNNLKTTSKKHEVEIAGMHKKLSSLLQDNEDLKKKLNAAFTKLNEVETENALLKQHQSSLKENLMSPLARSMSSLKVPSSSEEDGKSEMDLVKVPRNRVVLLPGEKPNQQPLPTNLGKPTETPKRNMEVTGICIL